LGRPYRILGMGLCSAGAVFAPVAYFIIDSAPLTAIGISALIIGFTSIALSNTRPDVSPEACQLMLKTGTENTAALLEELGLRNKAVYMPSTARGGASQALIPLADDRDMTQVRGNIPGRLIVRYGPNPDDMAIAVTTPGSIITQMMDVKLSPTATAVEEAATYLLVGVLDMARSVTVNMSDSLLEVEVSMPGLHEEDAWYHQSLGSPVASIVAAIASEALGKPIRIKEESKTKGKSRILLEVLS